MNFSWHAPDG